MRLIDADAPTIEPKKGKWIYREVRDYPLGYDVTSCSMCGFKMLSNPNERFRIAKEMLKFNYCPNCGAKMKSE